MLLKKKKTLMIDILKIFRLRELSFLILFFNELLIELIKETILCGGHPSNMSS